MRVVSRAATTKSMAPDRHNQPKGDEGERLVQEALSIDIGANRPVQRPEEQGARQQQRAESCQRTRRVFHRTV